MKVSAPGRIQDLLDLMARLRAPEGGCPWDREQDFSTIAPYTIEEAYEVADAIERGDMADLKDELGDLLFQVVFHAQMAAEAGAFDFADVVDAIERKMVRRHPHVFADAEKSDWEAIKAAERKEKGNAPRGLLDDVPRALPALPRAVKLQKRAATVGFDWAEASQVFDKLDEEIGELKQALADGSSPQDIESELGDIMFVVANLARKLGLDPEKALASTNLKFSSRFRYIEQEIDKKGLKLQGTSLDDMETLWTEAKRAGL